MILTLIAVGIIGLLIGCRFRITTLVFANAIIVCAIGVGGILEDWSIAKTGMLILVALTVSSSAYLIGLSLFRVFRCVSAKQGRSG